MCWKQAVVQCMREMEWGMGLYLASMDVITPKIQK
jgi:hypothetical protein